MFAFQRREKTGIMPYWRFVMHAQPCLCFWFGLALGIELHGIEKSQLCLGFFVTIGYISNICLA